MKRRMTTLFVLLVLLIAACGGEEEPESVEIPTPAQEAVAGSESGEAAAPTDVPPTATIAATLPPPVLATPIPTSTPAEAVAEAPEETAAGIVLLSAEDFGTDRNPLTGELVSDPALLQRRPVAVKISNAPPSYVRPQSGLNTADLVFEHITEGALTRFTAIFYSEDPDTVGPIRSARLIDVELPAMYDAGLAYSGCSIGVCGKLNNSDFASRLIRSSADGYYRTGDESKPYEHTFYGYTDRLRNALGDQNRPPAFGTNMAFSSEPPAGGTAATEFVINYRFEEVVWQYDATSNQYLRWAAGVPHNDGNTNEQVRVTNVIVPFINHVDDPSICEEVRDNTCVALSVEIQLWGSGGPVAIFRDGQRFDGTWRREGRNDMLTFYDENGEPIPLQIGNSWFSLMSGAYPNPLTVTQ